MPETPDPRHEPEPRGLSRRALLGVGFAIWVSPTPIAAGVARNPLPHDVYARLRGVWRSLLVGGFDPRDTVIAAFLNGTVASAMATWNTMDTSASRTALWSDAATTTISQDLTTTADRLRTLAIVLSAPGSSLQNNQKLRSQLIGALEWFLEHRYAPTIKAYDNWYDWEIGVPLRLCDVGILLYDSLTIAQRARLTAAIGHFSPDAVLAPGVRTGANLVWDCSIAAVRAVLSADGGLMARIPAAIAPIYQYATEGDGFYADGSFIQHTSVAYNGSYGVNTIVSLANLLTLLQSTAWAASSDQLATVMSWVKNSVQPFMFEGRMMDMVRGREISRFLRDDRREGEYVIAGLLQLAEPMPSDDAEHLRALSRQWLTADDATTAFVFGSTQFDLTTIGRPRAVLLDSTHGYATEPLGTRVFPSMARAVHRRPAFALGIAMATNRIRSYESLNDENLTGWYTGFGATSLNTSAQPDQFANPYWATKDPLRIPGTTVDTGPLAAGAPVVTTNVWAGGATLDGYGAIGTRVQQNGLTLTGQKSWFCVDDVVVCLGSGISSTDGRAIETIVEDRQVRAADGLVVDGVAARLPSSRRGAELTPSWAWINGAGGYVFSGSATVRARATTRTGTWTAINGRPNQDAAPHSQRYLSLWFDHGTDPVDAGYFYVLLPAATPDGTHEFANRADVTLLADTAAAHGVVFVSAGVTMITFWEVPTAPIGGVIVDRPCTVVLLEQDDTVAVSVADPTQLLDAVTVVLQRSLGAVTELDPAISAVTSSGSGPSAAVKLKVGLTGARGASRVVRFLTS